MPASISVVAALFACGCAHTALAPDDSGRVCRIAVERTADAPVFHGNKFFDPVGGPALGVAGGVFGFFTVGPFAIAAAAQAAQCGAASVTSPTAELDLQNAMRAAGTEPLERALAAESALRARGCGRAGAAAPETRVVIERIDYGMMCPETYRYWIEVKWRAVAASGDRALGGATTRCIVISSRTMEEWVADPGRARAEVERALARTGERVAAGLLATDASGGCVLRSDDAGEVEASIVKRAPLPPASEASQ